MKRLIAALLCVMMIVLLLPVSAMAAYSTTSTKGVELVYPEDRDYFKEPIPATVKYFEGGDGIYYMPMPEAGHGNLGSIASGKKVTILAEKDGYAFFVNGSGRFGWNGMNWFDYKEEDVKAKVGGPAGTSGAPVLSTKGVRLLAPRQSSYLAEPKTMTVKASHDDGAIYLMPMPESGHGNLGTVASGETVTILAESGGYYYFETEDGRCGWNGTMWFK